MGKTHKQKMGERQKRLSTLPRKERMLQSATIKKKEGRTLDGKEKHALMMSGELGRMLRMWEKVRTADEKQRQLATDGVAETEEAAGSRTQALQDLIHAIVPKFNDYVKTPKVSRVIQSCIKMGTSEIRERFLALLAKQFAEYCNDAFAHYVIEALVRHADRHLFHQILALVLSVMPSIVGHKFGMTVVQSVYGSSLAGAHDRNMLLLGVFKDSVAVMKGWKGYPCLEDVLKQEPTHAKRLLTALFTLVDKIISVKEGFAFPFVQRLVYIYLTNGEKHAVMELVDSLKSHVVSLVDSREGALLGALVYSLLEPKLRKEVLRHAFEAGIVGLACAKQSAPFVARLFDLSYDPQLLTKYVVAPIIAELPTVLSSPHGHLVLLHLLTPSAESKAKALPPSFVAGFNLYSLGNESWKYHTWHDANRNEETVEICPRDAGATHIAVLGSIVKAILVYIRKWKAENEADDGDAAAATEAGGKAKKLPPAARTTRHFLSRIVKEIVHLRDPANADGAPYRAALSDFDDATEALLTEFLPKNMFRDDDEDAKGVAAAPAAAPVAASKAPAKAAATGAVQPAKAKEGKKGSKGKEVVEQAAAAVEVSKKRRVDSGKAIPVAAVAAAKPTAAAAAPSAKARGASEQRVGQKRPRA